MRVAITEGPPFWGEALAAALRARGDEVVHLTSRPGGPHDRGWDAGAGTIEGPGLADVDGVVNLYGSSPVRRWSASAREQIRATRITGVLTVVSALEPDGRCQRFLSRSSTAFYGERASDDLAADAPRGHGFLARAIADWEGSARHAPVPTALLRTPAVLSPRGGHLATRRGWLRGRLGNGRQFVPWIHLADWVAATLFLLDGVQEGPVNLVAPQPSREADLVTAWAGASGRRPPPAVPDAVLNARFGAQAAAELWLTSTRAIPHILTDLGFTHRFGSLDAALADVVAASQTR